MILFSTSISENSVSYAICAGIYCPTNMINKSLADRGLSGILPSTLSVLIVCAPAAASLGCITTTASFGSYGGILNSHLSVSLYGFTNWSAIIVGVAGSAHFRRGGRLPVCCIVLSGKWNHLVLFVSGLSDYRIVY